MGFYYISLSSIVPLAIAYGVLGLVFWGIARLTRGMRARAALLGIVGAVFLLLPVSEELWIAWTFGQACKEAGTFIVKKVQVDGFYDDTMRSAYENTKRGSYRFVEQRTEDRKGVERVEQADKEAESRALAWYVSQNPDKALPKSVIFQADESVRIVVFPSTREAWKVTKLDRPTARYHFRNTDPVGGTSWGHKVVRLGSAVIDTEMNEEIARRHSEGEEDGHDSGLLQVRGIGDGVLRANGR